MHWTLFQNIRNILQKLNILLTPDQEYENVLRDISVVAFRNDKSCLNDHLVRAKLSNVETTEISKLCGKLWWNCHVFDSMCDKYTFTTKVCGGNFKIKSEILNCNSQKVVYLLICRICSEALYVGKQKQNVQQDLIIIIVHICLIEKSVKYHSSAFMNIMGNAVIMGLIIDSLH